MSHKRRSKVDRQPVTRRYVRAVVQRARDDILSAIVHSDWTFTSAPMTSAQIERRIGATNGRHVADSEPID